MTQALKVPEGRLLPDIKIVTERAHQLSWIRFVAGGKNIVKFRKK